MTRPVPTNIILEMNKRGYKDVDILRYLKQKGYTPTEMSDGFNQAKVKLELDRNQAAQEQENESEPVISHFPKAPPVVQRPVSSDSSIQILQVKMRSLEEKQKQQLAYLENLRDQIIKKIQEDSSRMKEVSAQVSALQQAFSKVLQPLASNVKAKSGMLKLNESREENMSDSDEDKVVVIKETTKTVEKSKPKSKSSTSKKKKEKSSLDDQFGK
jgi:hypothetical protein